MAGIGSGEVELLEGLGGAGGRLSGQAAVGLPVVVAVRGWGGSPVQGGDAGAVACDAAGALEGGGQPRTLPTGPARPLQFRGLAGPDPCHLHSRRHTLTDDHA